MEAVMKKSGMLVLVVAMCMRLDVSFAADMVEPQQQNKAQIQQQDKAQKPAQIYGRQLMTGEERAEFRARMRSLKTQEERDALHREHHQKMQERAKAQGMTLPDMPVAGSDCPAAGSAGGCSGSKGCPGCPAGGCPGCSGAGGCPGCSGMQGGMHGAMHEKMHGTQGAPQAAPKVDAASGVHSH